MDPAVCQSTTAREAVEVLTSLIDRFGSSEANIAMIADRSEARYAADYEDAILSPGLESLAAENGFAVYARDGRMDLPATCSGDEAVSDDSHMRTRIGRRILSSGTVGDCRREELYPLCCEPEEKAPLQAVMEILRNRFEGTEYSPDETGCFDCGFAPHSSENRSPSAEPGKCSLP